MRVENPLALRFILQDEIYLLNYDKALYNFTEPQQTDEPVAISAAETTVIIAEPEPQPVIEKTQPISFNYLGGHKKNMLVLVYYPELEFIDESHLTALQNIFKRLELTLDDVAIFNLAKYADSSFDMVSSFFKPQKTLLLGAEALPIGISKLELNTLTRIGIGNVLYSFSFAEMMDNNDRKKLFWEQMKQL